MEPPLAAVGSAPVAVLSQSSGIAVILHSCQLSRNVRDSPGFLPAVPAKKLLSRIFYPHWKCTNLCPELVDTLQHSQDTFSNTRAFTINGFVSNYVHFDLLSTWETPQKWAWPKCVGVVGVVCPGSPF